jgi:hypothetical protein
MRRNLAYGGGTRPVVARGVSSIACLAFVVVLAIAFWTGAVWIGQAILRLSSSGF